LANNLSSNKLTFYQIYNILALRYDTSQKSNLSKLNWSDFIPSSNQPSLELIESLIKKSIENKIDPNTKKLSIALSGGIDSILVLSITKKYFPEIEINAFSVQFSNSIDETQQAQKIAYYFDINYNKIFIENYLQELPKAINIVNSPFGIYIGIMYQNKLKNHHHLFFLVMVEMSFLEGIHSDMRNILI